MKINITYVNSFSLKLKNDNVAKFCYYIFIMALIVIMSAVYFQYVIPSLDQVIPWQLYSDSVTYEKYALKISDMPVSNFISVNSNLLGMALLYKVVGYNRNCIVLFNVACLAFTLYFLKSILEYTTLSVLFLLIINPLVFFSILTLNKEIPSLLVIALLIYSITRSKRMPFVAAFLLSFFVRYQLSLFLLVYIWTYSNLNPFKRSKKATIIVLLIILSILFSIFSKTIFYSISLIGAERSEGGLGIMNLLNEIQKNGGYFLIAFIKVIYVMFALISKFSRIGKVEDFWNYTIILAHSFASFILCIAIIIDIAKKKIPVFNEIMYIIILYAVVFGLSPIFAPRYFLIEYFLGVLLITSRKLPRVSLQSET